MPPSSRSRGVAVDPDLGSFLDYLRLECGLADNTLLSYRRDLVCLTEFLDGETLARARREQLLDFVASQNRKFSPATVSRRIAALRMFYKYLRMEQPRMEDPSSALERPSAWQRLPRVLSPGEIDALLADKNRLRVLCALRGRELCVCQITEFLGLAPSTVSKHMSILHQARLVDSRKEGRWSYYRLAGDDAAAPVRAALAWTISSLSSTSRIREDAKALKQILKCHPGELCRKQPRK